MFPTAPGTLGDVDAGWAELRGSRKTLLDPPRMAKLALIIVIFALRVTPAKAEDEDDEVNGVQLNFSLELYVALALIATCAVIVWEWARAWVRRRWPVDSPAKRFRRMAEEAIREETAKTVCHG